MQVQILAWRSNRRNGAAKQATAEYNCEEIDMGCIKNIDIIYLNKENLF